MSNPVRRHLIFYGRVQGVAFRYRVQQICNSLGLTGWVRNCYDGSVEMEVQGTSADISEMIRRISAQSYIEITGIEQTELEPDPTERRFRITGY